MPSQKAYGIDLLIKATNIPYSEYFENCTNVSEDMMFSFEINYFDRFWNYYYSLERGASRSS